MIRSDGRRRVISVIVPIFNERAVLPELLTRLQRVAETLTPNDFEFVFVDDGSTDGSAECAAGLTESEPRLRVVLLRRNYGQTAALQVGFEHATGDVVISMDGDLQHFPEDIPAFLAKIDEGYDVVCGWRHERQEGVLRRGPSAAANWLLRRITGLTIHDIGTTFRAYTAEIAHEFRLLGEHHRFVPVFARNIGARLTEVKIQNIERPAGRSNYGLSRTLNVFLDMLFLAFYVHYLDRPIRLFGRIALATLAAAAVITAALAWQYLSYDIAVVRERSGWFTLALVMYVAGVQFALFGVVSELLVRMYFYPARTQPYSVRHVIGAIRPKV